MSGSVLFVVVLLTVCAILPVATLIGLCVLIVAGWAMDRIAA